MIIRKCNVAESMTGMFPHSFLLLKQLVYAITFLFPYLSKMYNLVFYVWKCVLPPCVTDTVLCDNGLSLCCSPLLQGLAGPEGNPGPKGVRVSTAPYYPPLHFTRLY